MSSPRLSRQGASSLSIERADSTRAASDEERTEQLVVTGLTESPQRRPDFVGATLTVLRGPGVGRVYWLKPGANVLGRAKNAPVYVQVSGVSRNHAQIVESGGVYIIEDLGSTNGTFVSGQLVTAPIELHSGAQVNLGGHAMLRFALEVGNRDSGQVPLFEAATRDRLTSTRSVRAFREQLHGEWVWTQRSVRTCALLLLEVDGLDAANSCYGSGTGDLVLREVARRADDVAGPEHVLARFLAGTFALFCRAIRRDEAIALAEALLRYTTSAPVVWKDGSAAVNLCIGVASSDDPNIDSPEALLARASGCLQRAKRLGKNRIADAP